MLDTDSMLPASATKLHTTLTDVSMVLSVPSDIPTATTRQTREDHRTFGAGWDRPEESKVSREFSPKGRRQHTIPQSKPDRRSLRSTLLGICRMCQRI